MFGKSGLDNIVVVEVVFAIVIVVGIGRIRTNTISLKINLK